MVSRSARGAGEEPDAEVALERSQAFGDRLLADTEVGSGELELPLLGDGDERPDRFQVHAHPTSSTTNGYWQATGSCLINRNYTDVMEACTPIG